MDVLKELGPYIAILLAIVGIVWRSRGVIENYNKKLDQIITSTNASTNLIGNLSHILAERGVIDNRDLIQINSIYVESLKIEPLKPNPITAEELKRINEYINKVKNSILTPEEFEDFKRLILKLKIENPNAASTTKLQNYQSFIEGTYGSSSTSV